MSLIGQRLKAARLGAEITQDEAAEAAGVVRTTISNWEAGRNMPCLIQFRDLCALYGASERRVLAGTSAVELTVEEAKELTALTVDASPGLRRKVDLMLRLSAAVA